MGGGTGARSCGSCLVHTPDKACLPGSLGPSAAASAPWAWRLAPLLSALLSRAFGPAGHFRRRQQESHPVL